MKTERYLRTSNFNLASFLFTKEVELVDVDKITDKKRAVFVFITSPAVEELTHAFSFAKDSDESVMVDVRKLTYATKALKEKLYQDNF